MTDRPDVARLRFAPSPTGPIHVGNAHTMLFNWLWSRHLGAAFVLRFEDTDRERSKAEWEEVITSEMTWLGLDWDEGPDIGGPFAPYRQTARMATYQTDFENLRDRGAVYPCYCTPDELAIERKEADRQKVPYKYSRRCLHLTPEARAAHEAAGRRPVWRLQVPTGTVIAYDDVIRGRIEFLSDTIGDPVIVRANGVPLYNFAVVVDDISMAITDVVRGEGHISNTPIQVLLYQTLGVTPPRFAHCSHLLNADRGKISKRKGEMSVRSFRERGILPEALFTYLATLGWAPADQERERFTREEIVAAFDIRAVSKTAAIFSEEKLQWMNGVYIRQKSQEEFAELALPFVITAGLATEHTCRADWPWFVSVCSQVQERVRLLDEAPEQIGFFFGDLPQYDEKAVQKFLTEEIRPFLGRIAETLASVTWDVPVIEHTVRDIVEATGQETKKGLQAIRVAISGRTVSPPLFDMLYLVGRSRSVARLERWR